MTIHSNLPCFAQDISLQCCVDCVMVHDSAQVNLVYSAEISKALVGILYNVSKLHSHSVFTSSWFCGLTWWYVLVMSVLSITIGNLKHFYLIFPYISILMPCRE